MSGDKISKSELNLKKRMDFYDNLHRITFDFEIDQSKDSRNELDRFIIYIGRSAKDLQNICNTTIKSLKGSTTRRYLSMISNSANALYDSLNKITGPSYTLWSFGSTAAHGAFEQFEYLCYLLSKTSKAHFVHILNKSTLDYDPTRKKLLDLSKELELCKHQLLALANGVVADYILLTLNSNDVDHFLYASMIDDNGYVIKIDTEKAEGILKVIRVLRKLKKYKNFNAVIDGLSQKLPNSKGSQHTDVCYECRRSFSVLKLYRCTCDDSYHGDVSLCMDCLRRMAAKRRYKCPRCGRPLNKKAIIDFIETF